MEWGPSAWGQRFTGSGNWKLQINEDLLLLFIGSSPLQAVIQTPLPILIHEGIFWTDLTLFPGQPSAVRVDGIPNRYGHAIKSAIQAVLTQKQQAEKRREEDERRISRYERLETNLVSIGSWCREVHAVVQQANSRRRWVTTEQVHRLLAAKPELSVTSTELQDLLSDAYVRSSLRQGAAEADKAAALWQSNLSDLVARRNERLTVDELCVCKGLFDSIESKPLTEEQARAVICFDNRVQVVASAGSGKTSTMVAKAAYAIHRKLVEPENMVLLAFNTSAASELKARIQRSFKAIGMDDTSVEAMTFHALGSQIIGKATGKKPRVPAWIKEKDEGIQRLGEIIDHLKDQSRAFRARWDMFRLVFGHDLPGFGKPSPNYDWDSTQKRAGLRTLAGEVVKSSEECVIANWLFYNGVDYVYERAYEFDTATSRHSQYHPDFYYPQIKLYHEHFALDKKGNPPADFEGYMDGVLWKRGEHRRRGTDFIETASYQLWSGKLFKNLSKELTSRGIELDPNPDRTLPENGKAPLEECALIELVRSFICHAKSNCLSSEDLKNRSKNMPADSFRVRHSMFLALIEPIRDAWEAALLAEKGIDFEDMLNQAAEHIEQGRYQSKYELVLADEFQDSSWARARLCLALVNNPNRHLFAVGDDWQSINRFAGADVSVMTGFHDWCGQGQILKLEQTFRCPQALCDVSGHFVSKNPKQLTKQVRSVTPSYGPVLQAFQLPQKDQVSGAVLEYLKDLHQGVVSGKIPVGRNGKISVFILGRYRQDGKYLPRSWRHEFGDLLDVKFLTMHTSKGAEADYVVLPGMVQRGFPNLRREDPVLSLAMPGCDTFLLAEERRLFYVALTRARRSVAMFTVKGQTSPFLDELVNDGFVTITDTEGKAIEEQRCPVCKRGVLIERSGKYGPFLGCSSYPECRYTLDLGKGKQPPTRNLAHG